MGQYPSFVPAESMQMCYLMDISNQERVRIEGMVDTDLMRWLAGRGVAVIPQLTGSFFFDLKDECVFLPQMIAVLHRICRTVFL
jgi:hypothetical protein